SSGGLIGGATNAVGSTAGGVANGVGNTVGSVGANTTGTVSGATRGPSGQLTSQSQGVIGLNGLQLSSGASNSTQGSVITSAGKDVKLDSGTQMLLQVNQQQSLEQETRGRPFLGRPFLLLFFFKDWSI